MRHSFIFIFIICSRVALSKDLTVADMQAIDRLGDFPQQRVILTKKDHIHRFTTKWYKKYKYENIRFAILKPRSILFSVKDQKKIQNSREIVVQIQPKEDFKHQMVILDKQGQPIYFVNSRQLTIIDDIIDMDPRPKKFTLAETEQPIFINPAYFLHLDFKYYVDRYRVEPYRELFQSNPNNLFSQKAKFNLFLRGLLPVYFGLTTSVLHDTFSPGEDNQINRFSFYLGPLVKSPPFAFWSMDFTAYVSFEHGFFEKLTASDKLVFLLDSDILEAGIEMRKNIFGQKFIFGASYYRQWISYESEVTGINVDSENNVFDGWSLFAGVQFTYQL